MTKKLSRQRAVRRLIRNMPLGLSLALSRPLVWIIDRLPSRVCTEMETAGSYKFCALMADPDVNRIVREKPVDYMGWKQGAS